MSTFSSPHAYSAAPVRGRKACSTLPGGARGSGTTSRRTPSPSGLVESHAVFPLMAQLERELRNCRREAYLYMKRHDAVWLQKVEAHVRTENEGKEDAEPARARRWEGAGCGRGGG